MRSINDWNPELAKYYRPMSRIALIGAVKDKRKVVPEEARKLSQYLKDNYSTKIEKELRLAISDAIYKSAGTDVPEEALPVNSDLRPLDDYLVPDPVDNRFDKETPIIYWPIYDAYFHYADNLWWQISVSFTVVACRLLYGSKLWTSVNLRNTYRYQDGKFHFVRPEVDRKELGLFLKNIQIIAIEIGKRVWPIYKNSMMESIGRETKHEAFLTCEGANSMDVDFDPTIFPAIWPDQEMLFLLSNDFRSFRDKYYKSLVEHHFESGNSRSLKRHLARMDYRAYYNMADYGLMGFGPPIVNGLLSCEPNQNKALPTYRIFGVASTTCTDLDRKESDAFRLYSRRATERFSHAF